MSEESIYMLMQQIADEAEVSIEDIDWENYQLFRPGFIND